MKIQFIGWQTPNGEIVIVYQGPVLSGAGAPTGKTRLVRVAQHCGDMLRRKLNVKRLTPRYQRQD